MIQADPATNSLIISGPEPLYRNIRAIVDKLDVRPAQVLIESLVVELSGDKSSEFGIQWQALNGLNNSGTSVVGGTNFGNSSQNIISGAQNLGNLGQGLNIGVINGTITVPGIGSITNIGLLARALETTANANILQRPNIQTLDNEEGKFLVGQNVPIVTGSFEYGNDNDHDNGVGSDAVPDVPAPGCRDAIARQAAGFGRRLGAPYHLHRGFLGFVRHQRHRTGAQQAKFRNQRYGRGRQFRRDQRHDLGSNQ